MPIQWKADREGEMTKSAGLYVQLHVDSWANVEGLEFEGTGGHLANNYRHRHSATLDATASGLALSQAG